MSAAGAGAQGLTGMVDAVLNEIAERAANSCRTGLSDSIDLTSIPLTSADRTSLEARLGRGEVFANVAVVGRSEVWETAYSGVWFVRHFGDDGCVAVETIEFTDAPNLLFSHLADRLAAATRLRREFGAGENSP